MVEVMLIVLHIALVLPRMPRASMRTPSWVARTTLHKTRTLLNFREQTTDTSQTPLNKTLKPMNRDQLNVTEMGSTVSAYMTKNKTLWNIVKAIMDTMKDVDANLEAIAEADKK